MPLQKCERKHFNPKSGDVVARIFGTNGVRGITNTELTIETVKCLASSSASLLGKNISLGMDARTSSPMFKEAAASGLLSIGCNIHYMGAVPTPTLQYMTKQLKLDGGIMVTASHNPPEFNGVKVMASDGVEIPRYLEKTIEDLHFSGGPKPVSWDKVGTIKQVEVIGPYIDAVLSHVEQNLIKQKKLKIALDPGNGVTALTAPKTARKLGAEVNTINSEIDGTFPGRGSEPRPEKLEALSILVKATESDFGLAFDGDGDRSVFVDEKGEVIWGDRSFGILAQAFLEKHPGSIIATAVSSSKVLEDIAKEFGGSVHWTKVGAPDVSRAMVNNKIPFGGEENGGIMYGPHHPVRDGTMALALMAELLTLKAAPLSKLLEGLPKYAQAKSRINCPNVKKQATLKKLLEKVEAPIVDTIDGVKLTYEDGSWILIRPSGTEPIFRLYAEAPTNNRVMKILEKHENILKKII
jgi:phosphomannomutase/phosphoglucomutase